MTSGVKRAPTYRHHLFLISMLPPGLKRTGDVGQKDNKQGNEYDIMMEEPQSKKWQQTHQTGSVGLLAIREEWIREVCLNR